MVIMSSANLSGGVRNEIETTNKVQKMPNLPVCSRDNQVQNESVYPMYYE